MASSQRCPECKALLKFANPVAAGKRVRCNKCDAVFAVSGGGRDDDDDGAIQPRSKVRAAVGGNGNGRGNGEAGIRAKSRRPAPDDDDYDDRPPKRAARDDDDADDFDDQRPRRGKAKGGKGLMIGLIAGGALLLIGGGILAFVLFSGGAPKEAEWLIGEWEAIEGPERGHKIEFTKDGKFISDTGFGIKKSTTYRLVSSTKLEVDIPPEERAMLEGLAKMGGKDVSIPSAMTVTVAITQTELTVHPPTEPPFAQPGKEQKPSKYRKVGAPSGGGDKKGDGDGNQGSKIVGKWEGASLSVMNRKIEFTADGRYIEEGPFGQTRNYRMNGATLEVDLSAKDREAIKGLENQFKDLGKGFKDVKIQPPQFKTKAPDKWRFKVTVSDSELALESEPVDFMVANLVPGGAMMKQKYKRVGAKEGKKDDNGGERDIALKNQLRQIGLAYHNYISARKKGPAKAEDLLPFMENDRKLLGLLQNDVVLIYGVRIEDMAGGASNTILGYEREAPTRGGYVLLGDADVKHLSAEEFRAKPQARPSKDPPKDNPDLARLLVGGWEGTNPPTLGRKVEFTGDGKFIQHTEGRATRGYKVVGSTIELEFTAADRARIPDYLKIASDKIPSKWVFKATATESQLKLYLQIDPKADRSIQVLAPGGIDQVYKRTTIGKVDPPKDPPKDDPQLAKALVGAWKGTSIHVEGKKATFTADGKFYHSAENNKLRRYRVSGTNVEVDFLPGEREELEKIAKQLGQKVSFDKWVYAAKLNGSKLTLDPQVGFGVGNSIPGGPIKQEYVRDGDPTPPKDPPKSDGVVGRWEMPLPGGQKRLVEFTKDRKFTEAVGNQSLTRTYSLHNNNTKLQVDLTDQERGQMQNIFSKLKLPKGTPRPSVPRHYYYNVGVNGDTLILEPAGNSQAVIQLNAIPGGPNRQTYKRVATP